MMMQVNTHHLYSTFNNDKKGSSIQTQTKLVYRQTSIFLFLVTLMASFYMLTFRARIESGDTLRALDAMTSQARFGDWWMDESVWFKYQLKIRDKSDLPLAEYDVEERLNIQLAQPLLYIAQTIPQLGNIHTVWLFNIIITSLNIGLVYLLLRALGYSEFVGVGVAISAGIATNMWAYSQTFFREPLVSFFVLVALLCAQLLRKRGYVLWIMSGVAMTVCMLLAYFTKFSALMMLPAVIIFWIPHFSGFDQAKMRYVSIRFLGLQLLGLVVLMLFEPFPEVLQAFVARFNETPAVISYALRIYILSPGGSIWGTSPVLLLAIIGSVLLLKRQQHRLVWTMWIAFIGYTVGHAITTGPAWFGGQSWPPRFLTPIIPILMLGTAPVLQIIIEKQHKWLAVLWVALLTYGIWIQFSSVSLIWYQYEASLPPDSAGLTEWLPGLINPQYFRWVVLPQRWQDLGFDFLWVRAGYTSWGVQFGIFTSALLVGLFWIIRHKRSKLLLGSPFLMILYVVIVFANLQAVYYKDPVTQSQKVALHEALDILTQEAAADDILILPNNTYERFILNHLDADKPRPIILPQQPAEPASEQQPAVIVSNNPNDWLTLSTIRVIHHIALKNDHFWYLANTSPFISWSFRPFERYMATYYYPLREVPMETQDDTVRLLEYSVRRQAPNPFLAFNGDYATDLRYGEHIQLAGFHLPNGTQYASGETIELSLRWQSDSKLDQDYTVAWFIASSETGQVVAQGQDSMPQAGFAPTTSWQPNALIWDNRAVRLPQQLDTGEYLIWVLLYRYNPETASIERLPANGQTTTDNNTIGVLPVTLTVN